MNGPHLGRGLTVILGSVVSLAAQIVPYDTTGPNDYYFSREVYYADPATATVTIDVGFIPGNRSWIGSVRFSTEDGTAQAGEDYTAVVGTLAWSQPALRSFVVPLQTAAAPVDKTITLRLHPIEPNCVLSRAEATLVVPSRPPTLVIASRSSNTIRLSWPAAYTNWVVETATGPAPDSEAWTNLPGSPVQTNGAWVLEWGADPQSHFFRLRKS